MGQISVNIGGRSYPLACGDGEEAHLTELAEHLQRKADELTGALGTMSEPRLLLMAGKLMRFTTFLAVPALVFGLWLYLGYGIGRGPGNGWMHAKLAVVVLAIGYHHACGRLLAKFVAHHNTRSHKWFRWFNEVPVLLLLAAVVLVVVKPF